LGVPKNFLGGTLGYKNKGDKPWVPIERTTFELSGSSSTSSSQAAAPK
jgi:hypothetical protein